ncbi:PLDc N-terminal domain-containing protein [Rathayibacter tanaceti]|uniref:Cardiolipin synthase N-terminal domain-containing protein n=2 Tax=Rathayibacter tanaceti TaxID=1671680 RepID=A0A162FW53_9MICO|nr:PLDc N-terminal domain-containing protein [Rathayibacter tanaceti]KZX20420.1 hypothetical protein ACH61_02476 [Rathayibacter tanaceti]QHC54849.1 hypothetical protein GSU10_03795 [Rathayibacter tanaceti]TCO38384.1 phospholipase D-like protein [Rathayibacter tanaceti]
MDGSSLATSLLVAVVGAAYVAFAILALTRIVGSTLDPLRTLAWVVAVVVAPFLGSLAWFTLGRPRPVVSAARLRR